MCTERLSNVILTRQSLIRPLRHIDSELESKYYAKTNQFWRAAIETVQSEISNKSTNSKAKSRSKRTTRSNCNSD